MPLDSIAEILASCSERNLAFWQVVHLGWQIKVMVLRS